MDLSTVFDTLNHDLSIVLLHAYDLTKKLVELIKSYLTNLLQRTMVNTNFSSWSDPLIEVPRGLAEYLS